MANMSYCRFENTKNDFQDCLNYLEEHETLEKLSDSERRESQELYKLAQAYIELYSYIEEQEGENDD